MSEHASDPRIESSAEDLRAESAPAPHAALGPSLPSPAPPSANIDANLADGTFRQLDPAYIKVDAISWWITLAVISGGGFLALAIVALADFPPHWGWLLGVANWIVATGLLLWGTLAWPRKTYANTRYALSATGLEIHRGVIWKSRIAVPLSRVQHTDVMQGPIMARFNLATLTIHTAGTTNASIRLPGLRHDTAMRIRDELIRGSGADAV